MVPYTAGERRRDAIKLSSNENPHGCSPAAAAALQRAIAELNIYPDGAARDLKTRLAQETGFPADQLILGNGSDEVLTFIAGTYLDPGDHVLIGEHTFSQYAFATHLFDGIVRIVPMPDLRYDLERFLTHLDDKVRMVFLCSPNNPTGMAITRAELEGFLEKVPPDVIVVMDHAYMEYQDDPACSVAMEQIELHPNLIVLRTFSKLYGLAAIRVGYGIGASQRVAELERVRSPFNVNSLAQAAATASLDDTAFTAATLAANREGRVRMQELFEELDLEPIPSQANFVTIRVPQELDRDARVLADRLAEEGFTVRPLGSFGLPQRVRITVGTAEQITAFAQALRRVLSPASKTKPDSTTDRAAMSSAH
jgi:histidinol-phosphate aminotransferase